MAHFAQLDENNMVIWITCLDNSIVTDENGIEQESLGIQHIHNTIPGAENYTWKQCSYNNNFRGRYPASKSVYIESLDIFTNPKPFDSWIFNTNILEWEPPIPKPEISITENEFVYHIWNEETVSWEEKIDSKPYPSWSLNMNEFYWESPEQYPNDGNDYEWDEENQKWNLVRPE